MKKTLLILSAVIWILGTLGAEDNSLINKQNNPVKVYFEVETGLFGILSHTYQTGRSDEGATKFDFVSQGGQDILFPFDRYVAGIKINNRHKIGLLYQPLTVETNVTFREDVMMDSVLFSAGTPMELKYGFPFYRFTYSYTFLKNEKLELAAGLALQARNANIVFKAVDGSALTVANNTGPVPSINLFGRYDFNNGLYLSLDATGLYASSAIINGASFAFEGSLLDASLRAGYPLRNGLDVFANLRFLGGTSKGESQYPDRNWSESDQRYGENYLSTMSFTLGLSVY
jgi:hypothetical protein